jgi:nitroreductase
VNVTEAIESRRSVHSYTDEEIDEDSLKALFERVRLSPSSFDLQPWEFLVVRDEENKARMQEVANGQEQVGDSAATVAVLGNTDPTAHAERVFDEWLDQGYLPNEDARDGLIETVEGMNQQSDEENRLWSARSSSLAAMTLMYAAWEVGIASCPMGGFDADALIEEFDIPDGYDPVMLVTLGYPEADARDLTGPRRFRRPAEEITHYETFDPVA